jgi:hypothetical protein
MSPNEATVVSEQTPLENDPRSATHAAVVIIRIWSFYIVVLCQTAALSVRSYWSRFVHS